MFFAVISLTCAFAGNKHRFAATVSNFSPSNFVKLCIDLIIRMSYTQSNATGILYVCVWTLYRIIRDQKSLNKRFYRAKCELTDDVISGVTTVDHTLDLCVSKSHCRSRKVVAYGWINFCVVTCVKASTPNRMRYPQQVLQWLRLSNRHDYKVAQKLYHPFTAKYLLNKCFPSPVLLSLVVGPISWTISTAFRHYFRVLVFFPFYLVNLWHMPVYFHVYIIIFRPLFLFQMFNHVRRKEFSVFDSLNLQLASDAELQICRC